MFQYERPRVTHPLALIHFWGQFWRAFSVDAGKRKCSMWLIKNVKIIFEQMGFVDSKCSNLNAPWPGFHQGHTPHALIHFWGPFWSVLFRGCRKREMQYVAYKFNAPRSYTPALLSFTFGVRGPICTDFTHF